MGAKLNIPAFQHKRDARTGRHAAAAILCCDATLPIAPNRDYMLRCNRRRFMISIFSSLVGRFARWRALQQAFAELYAMDDRALADIGLSRGDISAVAAGNPPALPRRPRTDIPAPANTENSRAA
jgi:uncharacterized protein YjiS (DUF1127 family)